MAERPAFGKGGNDNSNESRDQENANAMKCKLVASSPEMDRNPFEKLGDRPLAHPDEKSVKYACSQDKF